MLRPLMLRSPSRWLTFSDCRLLDQKCPSKDANAPSPTTFPPRQVLLPYSDRLAFHLYR
jgi:hypothetical protein